MGYARTPLPTANLRNRSQEIASILKWKAYKCACESMPGGMARGCTFLATGCEDPTGQLGHSQSHNNSMLSTEDSSDTRTIFARLCSKMLE